MKDAAKTGKHSQQSLSSIYCVLIEEYEAKDLRRHEDAHEGVLWLTILRFGPS